MSGTELIIFWSAMVVAMAGAFAYGYKITIDDEKDHDRNISDSMK